MREMIKNPQAFLSLHRYFIWANLLRDYFDAVIKRQDTKDHAVFADEAGLFMAHWYGALYVVVEGWQELDLHDPTVDELLKSQNVDGLKRFRNGAFHFQKQYLDDRFAAFWEQSVSTVPWVRNLNRAFGEYFLKELRSQKREDSLNQPSDRKR